jgi:heme/copper-type cytochrome/quinol oxidase subunit 3
VTATATTPAPASDGPARLALPPAPEPQRKQLVTVGVVLGIAAGVMLIAGLIGNYMAARDAADAWIREDSAVPNAAASAMIVGLIMSAVTAQWAVTAIRNDDRPHLYLAVGVTLVLGAAYINAQSFFWTQLGLEMGTHEAAGPYYALTGTHVVATALGMVALAVMGFRALGGQFSRRSHELVQSAAYIWHAVVITGFFVWFAVYFLEGAPLQ